MKRLVCLLAFAVLLLQGCGFYDSTTKILSQVYGTISTDCYQDANADTATTTTVDADSAAAQKTLNVAATTNFAADDVLVVNPGGAREEVCVVASVSAGVSVTCDDNLEFAHTAAQADPVHLSNRVPIADGTLLTNGRRYVVYCHDGAGAGVACECIMGDEDVTATNAVGKQIFAGAQDVMVAKGSNLAVSCIPWTDDSYIDVCPLD